MSAADPAEALRDTIVAAVSREMGVPVDEIMRQRRRSERATQGRYVAMYTLSEDVDRIGVPELIGLFDTSESTIDRAWWQVAHTPELLVMANELIKRHRRELSRLPKVADGRGEE